MRNTWHHYLRRLATATLVSGSVAWSSAVSYAVQVAHDLPGNSAYADGWQEGDNGGFGFGPWSFDGSSVNMIYTYTVGPSSNPHRIDNGLKSGTQSSSVHNDIGQAWTMYNFNGRPFGPANAPQGGTDITRAGRALTSALQVGQTVTVVIDNPIERAFYRGYNFKLNSGPGNVCYDGAACTPGTSPVLVWGVGTFEYFSYGLWGGTTLYDHDTDTGTEIKFTLTSSNAYSFTMTPLDNPSIAYTGTGTLDVVAPINWIEFQFYNTDSDFYPAMVSGPVATDFYIRSLEVTSPAPPGLPGDFNDDDKVDAADYVVWRKNNGGNTALPNDNGLGTPIGTAHFNLWRENFGEMVGAGSGVGIVPEAGTFVTLVLGGALMCSIRPRRWR